MSQDNTPRRKWSEETISMILGLAMVLVVSAIVIRIVDSNKGKIDIPGVSIEKNEKLVLNGGSKDDNEEISETGESAQNVSGGKNNSGYTVKKGDSLWKISESQLGNGWRWGEIAKLNKISDPGVIWSGMVLKLPVVEKKVTTVDKKLPVMGKDYIVDKGDSLWKIAVLAYGDGYEWTKIWEANKKTVIQPGVLEIGMRIGIPELESVADGKGMLK